MEPNTQPAQSSNRQYSQPSPIGPDVDSGENLVSFHSNGFAQAANEIKLGTVKQESFSQRRKLDSNRRVVESYQFSNMGRNYAGLRAKKSSNDKPKI